MVQNCKYLIPCQVSFKIFSILYINMQDKNKKQLIYDSMQNTYVNM